MTPHGIDVYDPEGYAARGVPHAAFARLRREAPVSFHPEPAESGGEGFWVLSRYEDVKWASKRPDLFSSQRGGTNIKTLRPEQLAQVRAIMLNMDPPEHRRFRALVNKAFTPRRMRGLAPRVAALSRRIVDDVCEAGRCELVADVAARLPMEVICEMVGVPEADREGVCALAGRLIGFDDPECQTSEADGQAAAAEMFVYAGKVAALRRSEPADDLATALLEAEVDGERLTELEFNSFFMLLAVAGNETTRTATCHAVRLLAERPGLRRRLAEEPGLLPAFVEEVLRYEPPILHFRRTATRDVELRGERIREGDKVTLWYPSANRDEAVFREPDRFDPERTPNDHLAFGIGEHFCLGASLARMELRLLLGELVARLPDLELDGPVRRLRSNFVNGVKAMPVRYAPAPRSGPAAAGRGTLRAP